MATSLAQGGSGFPYLYKGVYEYLTGKAPKNVTVDYTAIPDYNVRVVVGKVKSFSVFIENMESSGNV